MSETQDMPEVQTVPSDIALDFGPLIDSDTDSIELSQIPPSLRPARRRRRFFIVPLVILLLIALVGGGVFAYLHYTSPPPVQYTQATATLGNIAVTASATGPVQANAVYNMDFSASSGTIQAIYVHVGQQVKKGQKLAQLDSSSLQDAVNQAQQSLNAAESSVGSAQSSLGDAYSQEQSALNSAYYTEQNALNACDTNPTPAPYCEHLAESQYLQAREQAQASVTSAANQVTSAEQQVNSAQLSLQAARDNLKEATLYSPHAGVIEAINNVVGESASSSSSGSGSSPFIVLVDASVLNIAAQVNEADIGAVAVGQPAQFTVAAYPSQTFRASVTSIDTEGATSSNVVTYTVNLAVDMQSVGNSHVYPGMTATVNITTAESIGTLLVPVSALSFSTTAIQDGELSRSAIQSLTASGSGTSQGSRGIVVELKNGKLVPVLVTTGLTNGQFTQILSGLKEGDQVVVSQTGGQAASNNSSSGSPGGTKNGGSAPKFIQSGGG